MWMMRRVGGPQIRPQGDLVSFQITEPSYDDKEVRSDIWIVPSNGASLPRKITSGKGSESAYQWSPDGSLLLFTAKRDGDESSQLYLMDFDQGGEAQKLSNLSTGIQSPQWSFSGKNVLFSSSVFPTCFSDSCNKKLTEEKKKIKYKARVYETFPIRNWDHWNDEKLNHIFVQALHPDSSAKDLFANISFVKEPGFSLGAYCWVPGDSSLVFSASTELNQSAYKEPTYHLYSLSIKDGQAKIITSGNYEYSSPFVSEDGKYLYCLQTEINNYKIYNQNRLVRFNWPSMSGMISLCASLDRPIEEFIVKNNQIYVVIENQGRDLIYSTNLEGGNLKLITIGSIGCYHHLSVSNNGILVSNYESPAAPNEICLIPENGPHRMITQLNKIRLDSLDLPEFKTLWLSTKKKKSIRSMMILPPAFDSTKKYPLFVVMHGGPAGSWKENWGYRWNYHLLASPGYVVLLTDFTGSTGYGERFAREIQYDPFKGPADEINEAASDAIRRFPFIDGNRQAAGGASYGGHLANWMQATTTHYKCLISHAGLVNTVSQWGTSDAIYHREIMNGGTPWSKSKIWQEQNPIRFADQFKTPMLVTVGEQDFRVPVNNSIENWNILQRQKIPSKLIVFPDENHWILNAENSRFFFKELQDWLKRYL